METKRVDVEQRAPDDSPEIVEQRVGEDGPSTLAFGLVRGDASTGVTGAPSGTAAEPVTIDRAERHDGAVREARRQPHDLRGTSNIGDRIFNGITAAFAGLIVVVLAGMMLVLIVQSREAIAKFGFGFLTSTTWDPIKDNYGAASAILGTVYTSLLALVVAAPVGILIAIYLVEIAPRRLRYGLGFLVELLAAVPSIVFGLWALSVLVPIVANDIEPPVMNRFGTIPLLSGIPVGLGYFTAALILAIMILPTITAISRDVMMAVPNSQRDAMLALGSTRWEMIWKVVVPAARSGIIGAIVLALGRAVGETMAVQMVIGNTQNFNFSLFNFGTTITATLVNQFSEATGTLYRASLLELGLILMFVTILLNAIARLLVWRVASPISS